jgi:hypothetical protein
MSEFGPWTHASFLLGANARLDDATPLAFLRQGRIDDVLRAALAYGEQGAA